MTLPDASVASTGTWSRVDPVTDPGSPGGCELCGSAAHEHSVDLASDYITGARFSVRRCSCCGFGSTRPLPLSMDRYYPSRYRKYSGAALRALRTLYWLRVRRWARYQRRRGRALELGCGDGWMLGALRDRGWRVLGTERSMEGARSAAVLNRVPMFVGDFDALRSGPSFDLIILFQALEHLAEPFTTLKQGAELLDPGGAMVVAVPNFASWQARLFGSAWFHLDVPRHAHHFSPAAIGLAFEKVGLRVVRTRFRSFGHDPYGWIQSALNRLGFRQNLLTKWLMGMGGGEADRATVAAMLAIGGVLLVPSLVLAMCSWAAGSGAIMEVWAEKA